MFVNRQHQNGQSCLTAAVLTNVSHSEATINSNLIESVALPTQNRSMFFCTLKINHIM